MVEGGSRKFQLYISRLMETPGEPDAAACRRLAKRRDGFGRSGIGDRCCLWFGKAKFVSTFNGFSCKLASPYFFLHLGDLQR